MEGDARKNKGIEGVESDGRECKEK